MQTYKGEQIRWEGEGIYGFDKFAKLWVRFTAIEMLEYYMKTHPYQVHYVEGADVYETEEV